MHEWFRFLSRNPKTSFSGNFWDFFESPDLSRLFSKFNLHHFPYFMTHKKQKKIISPF